MAVATTKKTKKAAAKTSTKKVAKQAGKKTAASSTTKRTGAAGRKADKPATTSASKRNSAKKSKVQEPDRAAPAMAEVDADVLEFIAAIDEFKQKHGRPFPSWSEVLLIVRELGYRR